MNNGQLTINSDFWLLTLQQVPTAYYLLPSYLLPFLFNRFFQKLDAFL